RRSDHGEALGTPLLLQPEDQAADAAVGARRRVRHKLPCAGDEGLEREMRDAFHERLARGAAATAVQLGATRRVFSGLEREEPVERRALHAIVDEPDRERLAP